MKISLIKNKDKNLPFWIITIALFIGLLLYNLLQDGMFMDGLLYATISKNLAHGLGSFWFPHLTNTCFPDFHEHPPLVFGIQSLFFIVFGNSMYVERLYSFLTAVITGYLIIITWKQIFRNNLQIKNLSWLPVLFWITTPICFWSYSNNMLENTMGIFTILSILLSLKALQNNNKNILFLILSGISIFLATLSKGFVGMFPLATIFLYWLINRNISFIKMVYYSLILILVPLSIYLVLLTNNDIYTSLNLYLDNQVIRSIKSVQTVESRFFIVKKLFFELLPVIIIDLIVLIIAKLKSIDLHFNTYCRKNAIFFMLIAISGSFPIMISLKQSKFYAIPSMPFYAISLSIIIAPFVFQLINRINTNKYSYKIFMIFAAVLLMLSIAIPLSRIGKVGRDNDKLHDVYQIGNIVPKNTTISISKSIWRDWSLHGYFGRYFNISLDKLNNNHEYFLIKKNEKVPANYNKVEISLKKLLLFKHKTQLGNTN